MEDLILAVFIICASCLGGSVIGLVCTPLVCWYYNDSIELEFSLYPSLKIICIIFAVVAAISFIGVVATLPTISSLDLL
jgi:hypothetical protein